MTDLASLDGAHLKAMLQAGVSWLETNVAAVDALNVYPVPDGDTGSNMVQTCKAALAEATNAQESTAAAITGAVAHGALLGARGNSGVIFSQFLRGFAEALEGKEVCSGPDFAHAMDMASQRAYRAVPTPVEGTILSVASAAAKAAQAASDAMPEDILARATDAARLALAYTPEQLAVLKEAGVVDAGGQGLVLVLEGALAQLRGEPLTKGYETLGQIRQDWLDTVAHEHQDDSDTAWGYCTEFMLEASELTVESLEQQIGALGSSVLVVGDATAFRVHVHTADPGEALSLGVRLGTLHKVKVDNMQEQHEALVQGRAPAQKTAPPAALGVVAVAPGPGLAEVFTSMGAAVVPGGQTMNPSAQEIIAAADTLGSETTFLLPNNSNVIATCAQASELTDRQLICIPSRTVPQGITALLAFNPEAAADENAEAMHAALGQVQTIEITISVRDTTLEGMSVRQGQFMGLVDHKLAAVHDELPLTLHATLDSIDLPPGSLITLYYGEMVSEEEAEAIAQAVQERPDAPEVEVVPGGQPHYHYIASVES